MSILYGQFIDLNLILHFASISRFKQQVFTCGIITSLFDDIMRLSFTEKEQILKQAITFTL